jgi:hypothetical protein
MMIAAALEGENLDDLEAQIAAELGEDDL